MFTIKALLVAAVVLLAALVALEIFFFRRLRTGSNQAVEETVGDSVARVINEAVEQLGAATQHYTEVNAVLALTEQLKRDPELLRNLADYSREVVGAALLNRVNSLGATLKRAQDRLAQYLDTYNNQLTNLAVRGDIAQRERVIAELLEQLQAAHKAVEAFGAPHAVRSS